MARKNKFNWVWIAVLLSCAIFLGYQYFMASESAEQIVVEHAEEVTKVNSAPDSAEHKLERLPKVDAFVKYVSEHNPDQKGLFDGNYINKACNHLIDALENIVDEKEVKVDKAKIDKLKAQFEAFENADEKERSRQLKNTITATTGLIESIQINSGQEDAVENRLKLLKKDAEAINARTPLEKQYELLEDYFDQAASVLEAVEESV